MATNNAINVPSNTIALNGANADITSMTGLTGTLRAPTGIASSASLMCLAFGYTASAVNYLSVTNNVTGSPPVIDAVGTDSAIPISWRPKNSNIFLIDNTSTIAPALRFYNAAATHYTGLKVATAAATDVTFVLPSADAAGWMISDGSANLSLSGTPASISGTVTINGFSSTTSTTIRQLKVGKMVYLDFLISGTSNATSFTVTNLPNSSSFLNLIPILITNNGTNAIGLASINGTTIDFYLSPSSNVWTNSGTKSAYGSLWYEAA